MPICVKKERNGPASVDQRFSSYSQSRQLPCVQHFMLKPTHLDPPIPPFLIVQNLFSKRIALTDYMWPKLHDEYTSHQWLKIQQMLLKFPEH